MRSFALALLRLKHAETELDRFGLWNLVLEGAELY